jgi:hypothetical protein
LRSQNGGRPKGLAEEIQTPQRQTLIADYPKRHRLPVRSARQSKGRHFVQNHQNQNPASAGVDNRSEVLRSVPIPSIGMLN